MGCAARERCQACHEGFSQTSAGLQSTLQVLLFSTWLFGCASGRSLRGGLMSRAAPL